MMTAQELIFFLLFASAWKSLEAQDNRLPEICARFPTASICRQERPVEVVTTVGPVITIPSTIPTVPTIPPSVPTVTATTTFRAATTTVPSSPVPTSPESSLTTYCQNYGRHNDYFCAAKKEEYATNSEVQKFCASYGYYCLGLPAPSAQPADAPNPIQNPTPTTDQSNGQLSPALAAYCQQYFNTFYRYCYYGPEPAGYRDFCARYPVSCRRGSGPQQPPPGATGPAPGPESLGNSQAGGPDRAQIQQQCQQYQSLASQYCKGSNEVGLVRQYCDAYRKNC